MLDIIIDGVKYNYMGKMKLNDVDYVIYNDDENIHVSSYTFENNKLKLDNVEDKIYDLVLKEFNK